MRRVVMHAIRNLSMQVGPDMHRKGGLSMHDHLHLQHNSARFEIRTILKQLNAASNWPKPCTARPWMRWREMRAEAMQCWLQHTCRGEFIRQAGRRPARRGSLNTPASLTPTLSQRERGQSVPEDQP
ncbi:hypothetical protein D9M68_876700 [compost metagenome]